MKNLDFEKIGERVNSGAVIVYPTDTVYGIGCSIYSKESIKKIYEIKKRKENSPLIALVSSIEKIYEIAEIEEDKKDIFLKIASNFWPGGLTLILKKKDIVPDIMVSNGETVGVRIPKDKIALEIIEASGGIIPTTSANLSGEKSPISFDELSKEIKLNADILIDGGVCSVGEPSTIINLYKEIKLLREGAISLEKIEKVIGKI